MTGCIFQFGLLAQNDGNEWMNILFIVVVAVFWAIGGLVKASSNKRGKQGAPPTSREPSAGPKRGTLLQQLAKKAEEFQRAMESQGAASGQRPSSKPQGHPAKPPQPPQGQVAVRTGRGGRPVLVYERQAAAQPTGAPTSPKARPESPPEFAGRTESAGNRVKPSVSAAEPKALVIDYTDGDALKKAILHYEILGKPMALRDPFERSSLT